MRLRKPLLIITIILAMFLVIAGCAIDKGDSNYYGSSQSDVFHYHSCRYVGQINPENLITFSTRQEAINAGYHSCSVCKP